jgi:hypothetical protein
MNDTTNNGGPAFPASYYTDDGEWAKRDGMTLRQYAAIKLRVPNSGTDWLDAMIVAAKRDELAAKAMQSYLLDKDRDSFTFEQWANAAYEMADAMLEAGGQA